MTEKENFIKAIEFGSPEWIPVSVSLGWRVWNKYRERLEEIVLSHPKIFGKREKNSVDFDGDQGPGYRAGEYFRDNWGCVWYSNSNGIEGRVVESPLADWKRLETYEFPDYALKTERESRDWKKIKTDIENKKRNGELIFVYGDRLFDRLYFLRGFENLMIDIAEDNPNLIMLIYMLTEHELKLMDKWKEIGVDVIYFHSDIGTQNGLMISPDKFRKYVKPMFKTVFSACKNAGARVYFSSDGNLLEIVDDLVECGVSLHDPQLRANTLEGIKERYKRKLCVNLDLDAQSLPFCGPAEIEDQIKYSIDELFLKEGGLMMSFDVRDDNVSLEIITALIESLEKHCLFNKKSHEIVEMYC